MLMGTLPSEGRCVVSRFASNLETVNPKPGSSIDTRGEGRGARRVSLIYEYCPSTEAQRPNAPATFT
jgi:hypothetical protein